MPRTCLACSSSERGAIDKALVSGEPLRNIAKRVSISPAGLLLHKNHVAQSIVRASEKCQEVLGDSLLDEMKAHLAQRDNRASVITFGFRPGKQFPRLLLYNVFSTVERSLTASVRIRENAGAMTQEYCRVKGRLQGAVRLT